MRFVMVKVHGSTGDCTVASSDAIIGPFHDTGAGVLTTSWNFRITAVPDDVPNHRVRSMLEQRLRHDAGLFIAGPFRCTITFAELASGELVGP